MRNSNKAIVIIFTFILMLTSLSSLSASSGEDTTVGLKIDQEWWDGYHGNIFNCGCNVRNNSLGQSFIPTKPVLSSVDLYLTFVRPEGIIEVTIYKAKENGYQTIDNSGGVYSFFCPHIFKGFDCLP